MIAQTGGKTADFELRLDLCFTLHGSDDSKVIGAICGQAIHFEAMIFELDRVFEEFQTNQDRPLADRQDLADNIAVNLV